MRIVNRVPGLKVRGSQRKEVMRVYREGNYYAIIRVGDVIEVFKNGHLDSKILLPRSLRGCNDETLKALVRGWVKSG